MKPPCPASCCLAAAVALALLPAVSVSVSAQRAAPIDEPFVFIPPVRRAPALEVPSPPPLPAAAARVAPLTLELESRHSTPDGRHQQVRQTISRTADRIHVMAAGGREWLFESNPLDPRRASAQMVDHATRTIVEHDESDVRNLLGITGWAPLLMLGLEPAALDSLARTKTERTIAGMRFVKHVGAARGGRVREVWWNEAAALPAVIIVSDGGSTTRVSLRALRPGVAAERLRRPSDRLVGYKVVDVAEWLEGHAAHP